jgi:hypothetical protein
VAEPQRRWNACLYPKYNCRTLLIFENLSNRAQSFELEEEIREHGRRDLNLRAQSAHHDCSEPSVGLSIVSVAC